jgi:hypothetical protein
LQFQLRSGQLSNEYFDKVLGTGIALVPQRDPILTAKEVASVDLVSDGRFRFGVGVGWLLWTLRCCLSGVFP